MENNTLTTKTATSSLNYSGVVKIAKERNGKIIPINTFHNAGTEHLYKFISYCIGGKYKAAEEFRPQYIKLFYNRTDIDGGVDEVSVPILVSAINLATWDASATNDTGYKTILHFLIPYTFINGDKFNEVRLYCKKFKDDNTHKNHSASFETIDDNGEKVTIEAVDANDKKYNIIIDWELRIGNKIAVTTANEGE